jgi:hypothetical protein
MKKVLLAVFLALPIVLHAEATRNPGSDSVGDTTRIFVGDNINFSQIDNDTVSKWDINTTKNSYEAWECLEAPDSSKLPEGVIKKGEKYLVYDYALNKVAETENLKPIVFTKLVAPLNVRKIEKKWLLEMNEHANKEIFLTNKNGNIEGMYWDGIIPKTMLLVGEYSFDRDLSGKISWEKTGESCRGIIFSFILLVVSSIFATLFIILKRRWIAVTAILLGTATSLITAAICLAFNVEYLDVLGMIVLVLILIGSAFLKNGRLLMFAVGINLCASVVMTYLMANSYVLFILLFFSVPFFVVATKKLKI